MQNHELQRKEKVFITLTQNHNQPLYLMLTWLSDKKKVVALAL